jgi:nicotinamide-nucleotide adenylyltransferase
MTWEDRKIEEVKTLGVNIGKPYKSGFTMGRWQTFHIGHMKLINIGLSLCDVFVVFIGSSQASATVRNPFSTQLRRKIIARCYEREISEGKLKLVDLPDLTHETDITKEWEEYLINRIKNEFDGEMAQLMVCGVGVFENEDRRTWFSKEVLDHLDFHLVARDVYPISATRLRELLVNNDFTEWSKHTSPLIWRYFDELRDNLLRIPAYMTLLRR